MRQFFRRFRACEAGAGLVEYALLIAIVALGLAGALGVYRKLLGGLTTRTASTVSQQAGGGYGLPTGSAGYVGSGGGGNGYASSGGSEEPEAEGPDEPDPDPTDSDSTSAAVRAAER